jgi:ribonuclease HI
MPNYLKKNALCVDASCIGNPWPMEYQAVDLQTKKLIFKSPLYPKGTNNLGEFLAIYDAVRYIQYLDNKTWWPSDSSEASPVFSGVQTLRHYDCIFSDSETAIARYKSKKIKTTLKYDAETKDLLTKIQEAVTWIKTHEMNIPILKRETEIRWEIPADFNRK